MRRLVVTNIASLDGKYAAVDGDPLVLQMDEAFDRENLASIEAADIVLLGRNSFDGFSAYWPSVADAPEPADPSSPEGRAVDAVNRAISRCWNAVPKVVVSDRGPVPGDNAWFASTTVVPRAGVLDWLAEARADGEGEIAVFGSRVTWNALLAAGVVDELRIMVSPHPLGDGVPLFTASASLDLVDVRRYEDSSNVQLRYAPTRHT
jgi:dihydrofolate reductase